MKILTERNDILYAKYYMREAATEAKKSDCNKSQRGVVIVKNNEIIGRGYNKITIDRYCNPCIRKNIRSGKRAELCSAVHAEQMAIIYSNDSLEDSRLYHIQLEEGKRIFSGKPSCTVCSRMIYEAGISEIVLWHKEGYTIYHAKEFNELSFLYHLFDLNKGHHKNL